MKKLGIILIIAVCILIMPKFLLAQDVTELNQQIEEKKQEVDDLKKQTAIYQKNIRTKQEEAMSLKNQLSILENQIAKTELDVKATAIEIEQIQLETRNKELQILETEDAISRQKLILSETVQQIHQADSQNPLKIFLSNDSLSDFFNEAEYTKELQNSLQKTLSNVKVEKKDLLANKQALEDKKIQFVQLKEDLELQTVELQGENEFKDQLLVDTQESEQKFTTLYWQAKKEQEQISNNLVELEKKAREKLKQIKSDKPQLTDCQLSWPIPQNKITSTFHDPGYPFRYLFEHPAIDVRAKQGTVIKAPAEGYVLKAKDSGMGYSYISLIHAKGISTVYGHVSKILIEEDEYVAKGETIGLTGGMPGTPGAGRLSTGAHLHFEVRVNGIPVNALDYLP